MVRNHNELLQLAKQVKELDPTVEAYIHKDRLASGVYFIRGESVNVIHFHEVPYGWSGCGYPEFNNTHPGKENVSMPFTAEEVLHTFKLITSIKKFQPSEYYKGKEDYLKWLSYLRLVTEEDYVPFVDK